MGKETMLPKNIRQIGDIQGREKICIEDYVMTCIHKQEQQEDKGYLAIFLGERKETEDSLYVFIRGIFEVPREEKETDKKTEETKEDGASGGVQLHKEKDGTDDRDTFMKRCRKYFPDMEVQGCCVIGVYPTERMKTLMEQIPEAGRMIYHLQEQEESLYWTEGNQYQRIRGYFVFYEQNRRMQEYLADLFGENSVEKESLPDKAIRSFREKVREKGEKKHADILKIASSFFVVTILAVGAIVVNRIEDIRELRNAVSILGSRDQQEGEQTVSVQHTDDCESEAAASVSSTGGTADITDTLEDVTQIGSTLFWEADIADTEEASGTDSGSDAQAASSTGTDGSSDAQAASSTGTDGSSDAQAASSTGADSGSDAQAASGAGTDSGSDAQAASGAGTDSGSDAQAASSTGADSGSDTQAASGAGTDIGSDAQAASGAGTDSGSDTQATPTVGTDAVTDTQAAGTADDTLSVSSGADADSGTAPSGAAEDGAAGAVSEEEAQAASARQVQAAYVIKEGDTLAYICKKYYGSLDRLEDLCAANDIEDADVILPGQKIVLP